MFFFASVEKKNVQYNCTEHLHVIGLVIYKCYNNCIEYFLHYIYQGQHI